MKLSKELVIISSVHLFVTFSSVGVDTFKIKLLTLVYVKIKGA